MSNSYLEKMLISEIEKTLELAKKDEREYTRREKILFKGGKDTMRTILEQYFKEIEQRAFANSIADYVVERIILSVKQNKPKLLQQTYEEYRSEGKNIGRIKGIDKIMCCCPHTLQTTTEALDVIYKNASEYFEKSVKEETCEK